MSKVTIYGSTVSAVARPQDMYKCKPMVATVEDRTGKKRVVTKIEARDAGYTAPVDISWLAFAAPKYDISPNIDDYIIVNIPALTSDLPNRNSQAFTLPTLTEFDPEMGCLRYRTFVGKPAHVEHQNKILTAAKGIILDASLQAVPRYKLAKVNLLTAFCKPKDTQLTAAISSGKRKGYSMGALASTFRCSVCGGVVGPSIRRTCKCTPTDYNTLELLGGIYNGRLHYHAAVDPTFFEISSVADPADYTAIGDLV